MRTKTYVEDISPRIYDIMKSAFLQIPKRLTRPIRDMSGEGAVYDRLSACLLRVYNQLDLHPGDISQLNMDDIVAYIRPDTDLHSTWEDVPGDIKETFERLGITSRKNPWQGWAYVLRWSPNIKEN